MITPGDDEGPKVEAKSDAVCEFEIAIIDVAVNEGGAPEEVTGSEDEVPTDPEMPVETPLDAELDAGAPTVDPEELILKAVEPLEAVLVYVA